MGVGAAGAIRVLIVTSSFARFRGDPIAAHGNALYDLAAELGKRIEGTIVTHAGPDAPPTEELGGFTVLRVGPERPEAALHKALIGPQGPRVLAAARALRKEARKLAGAHDVAHGYWFFPGGWSVQRLGMPRVMTLPGPDIHVFPRYPVLGTMIKRTARAMDVCVAVDVMGRDILTQIAPKRVEYIPSPIRLDSFPLTPEVPEPSLVYVGRLAGEKGAAVLLEALALAHRDESAMTLEIVGDGPESAGLKQKAIDLGIADAVTFRGALGQPQVAEAIARARVLVLPSLREGLPSVALEALSSGRPVVASAVGGLPGLLEGGRGITVPRGDASVLASALVDAVQREWDQTLLHETAAGFAVERAADRYVALYRSLLEPRENAPS